MDKINTIMTALDFSGHSEVVFTYAAGLAGQLNADLLVASVINSRDVEAIGSVVSLGYDVDGEHYVESIKNQRRELLEGYLHKTGFAAERVRAIIRVGNPLDKLLKLTVTEDVQMLVMGVKGRSNLKNIFVGSIAEKLFRCSPVTVVSVRDDTSARRLRKRIHV